MQRLRDAGGPVVAVTRSAPLAIVSGFAVCAVLIVALVPRQQNADDLLTTIMSLQKVTLYFWEQDRFGNLLPALTAWIRDPTANAFAQIQLRIVAGIVAPVFFTALVFNGSVDAWRAALLANCLMLVGGSPGFLHDTLVVATPYGTSIACAGLAVLASIHTPKNAWRRAAAEGAAAEGAGALFMLAAYVVNIALPMVALPVLVLFALLRPSEARTKLVILSVASASIAFVLAKVLAAQYETPAGLHPSWDGCAQFAAKTWGVTGWPFVLAVALPTAAALLVWRTRIPRSYAILLLGCLVVAPTSFVLIASSDHVAANLYNPRYAIPVLLTLLATAGAGALLTLRGLIPSPPRRNAAFAATVAVLLLAAWARLSATPVSHTEFIELGKADVAQTIAYRYVALRLDGIAGDYWIVWPAVFETEQLHHDMAWQGADVLGISHRSKARRDTFIARLDTQRQLRVACIDMAPDDCAYWTMRATGVAGLRGQPFATPETIDGDHRLYYVTILPPS